jgi:L-ribulose-5-phosphate 3-epimerase
VKEYSRKKMNEEGLRKGFRVELLEGDCDWPAVMKALRSVGYEGWGTAEIPGGGRERLAQIARNMDRIFAS